MPIDHYKILLSINNLKVYYPITKGLFLKKIGDIKAVDDISFNIIQGENLGIVGESGCGKSSTGRAILQLLQPTEGEIIFDGQDLTKIKGERLRKMRPQFQMIFQDPFSSLDPRKTVCEIVREPLDVHKKLDSKMRNERVKELLDSVGLETSSMRRYPHEFSGGQQQRIGIAKALALNPSFIVCDEPVSSLDVSIQSQVINLLLELQASLGLTYLFISHDLSVVRHICKRIAVMYLGKIVEIADRSELYKNPKHPYTKALLSAIPIPDPVSENERKKKLIILQGDVPSPSKPPKGCNFCTRCPKKEKIKKDKGIDCDLVEPVFKEISPKHWTACHLF